MIILGLMVVMYAGLVIYADRLLARERDRLDDTRQKLWSAEYERDKARRQLADLTAQRDGSVSAFSRAAAERDDLREQLAEAIRLRDLARWDAEGSLERFAAAQAAAKHYSAQRDEARADLAASEAHADRWHRLYCDEREARMYWQGWAELPETLGRKEPQ